MIPIFHADVLGENENFNKFFVTLSCVFRTVGSFCTETVEENTYGTQVCINRKTNDENSG